MITPEYATATELLTALARREVSSRELTSAAIARIERLDAALNAVCVRDFERALIAADAADAARARGEERALLGVPMTIKESFHTIGLPTTWGFPQSKGWIADEDAVAVTRVKDAGAVLLGKTNVPLALGDWQSYNDIYGTTNNPYDVTRTPGGSSGGSAAALAAGYAPLSIGSDIGGSLRAPAHDCGVFAHKPTHALLASRGHTPPGIKAIPVDRDLGVIGPMARSARDLELLFDVLLGPEPRTAGVGYKVALPAPRHTALASYRVLVLDSHPLLPSDASVRGAIETLATRIARAGAHVARETPLLPDQAAGARLYMRLLFSILSSTMPLPYYESVRAHVATLQPHDLSLEAERARGVALSHRDWLLADAARAGQRERLRVLFQSFDVIICPIMPTPAFKHDHSPDAHQRRIMIDGVSHSYQDQFVWAGLATSAGLPATSIPIGFSSAGLPIGVQAIGPVFEDRTTLRFAELIERELGGFQAPQLA
jgi:amidase